MDSIKILDCPLCGGEPELRKFGNAHTKKRSAEIKCKKCNVRMVVGAIYHDLEWCADTATKNWNKRTYQPIKQ